MTDTRKPIAIEPAKGRLAILLPGLGAVSTTFIAGVHAIRRKLASPVGSLTQMMTIRLGARAEKRSPLIRDFVPLSSLDDLVFAGWDINDESLYDAAVRADVLKRDLLEQVADELKGTRALPAVFDQHYVKRLSGDHVKSGTNKFELVEQLREDIRQEKKRLEASRMVMVWCGSTEVFLEPHEVHQDPDRLEKALKENHPAIPPSMLYAYAAILEGVPYANGAPNLSADVPALVTLAKDKGVPIAGKDFKTGQTMMKTALAPAFKARMLGVGGWFSTNILGNRDGEVLDDPDSFKAKEKTKLGALEVILQPDLYPELYEELYHKVRINYYPPRGDAKEGWDNIDIFGWLGYPMQIKIDFLCRDSILAAPIVLDLALFLDLAGRAGLGGTQEWLSFYFKSPMSKPGLLPEHDLFIQLTKLKNTLRYLGGEELVTHLPSQYRD